MLTEVGSTPHSAVMLAARCMARVPVLSSSCRCAQVRTLQQLQESGHAAGQGQRHPHHVPALPAGVPAFQGRALPAEPARLLHFLLPSVGFAHNPSLLLRSPSVVFSIVAYSNGSQRSARTSCIARCEGLRVLCHSAGHRGRWRPSRPVSWRGRPGDRRCKLKVRGRGVRQAGKQARYLAKERSRSETRS